MVSTTAYASSWVATIQFSIPILLAIDALVYEFRFVRLFYFYLGVDEGCKFIYFVILYSKLEFYEEKR
jgi:hypothetical protein